MEEKKDTGNEEKQGSLLSTAMEGTTKPAQPQQQIRNGFVVPPPPTLNNPIIEMVFESCAFKAVTATVLGGLFGIVFGSVFATGMMPPTQEEITKPLRTQIIEGAKASARSGWSMGKNFALVGTIYTSTECFIEYARGKTDMWNGVSAGCLSGGILAGRAGPQAMAVGCAGFAAFSLAIDHFTGRHDPETEATHDNEYIKFRR